MQIAIFGTGGVGGYFGGRLAESGVDVTFIARGEHLIAMKKYGLRVDSIEGDFHLTSVKASDDPSSVGEVDVVLVATKAGQVPEAALAIRPLVGPDTLVIGLQNGVEAAGQLSEVLGADHVAGGFCEIISFFAGPGHIRHAGVRPRVVFGEIDNRESERCRTLLAAFDRARGLDAKITDDIHVAIWRKFLFIASVSGVGAVTRVPLDICRSTPETRSLIEGAMAEICDVARACDVILPDDAVENAMAFVDSLPAGATASMQRDIMEGRPSELDSQNGAVVRLGDAKGVATPIHGFLYHSLMLMERRARET